MARAAAPPRTPPAPPGGPRAAALAATVQYLVFEPGLYSVDIIAEQAAATDMGLVLPCARIEPVPATAARPGRASIVGPGEAGWLWRRPEPAFVLVAGGRAGAVMTIYRANDGMPAPEIRIRHIHTQLGAPPGAPAPAPVGPPAPETPGRAATVALDILAHITRVGDVRGQAGAWVGQPGGGKPIEGFSVTPADAALPAPIPPLTPPLEPPVLTPDDIEYQAILGNNWSTPWFSGGAFCGSRGLMLPLLGFSVRPRGAAAEAFECVYRGRFIGGGVSAECRDGAPCHSGDAPLEAFFLVARRREGRQG